MPRIPLESSDSSQTRGKANGTELSRTMCMLLSCRNLWNPRTCCKKKECVREREWESKREIMPLYSAWVSTAYFHVIIRIIREIRILPEFTDRCDDLQYPCLEHLRGWCWQGIELGVDRDDLQKQIEKIERKKKKNRRKKKEKELKWEKPIIFEQIKKLKEGKI